MTPTTHTEAAALVFPDPKNRYMSYSEREGLAAFVAALLRGECDACRARARRLHEPLAADATPEQVVENVSVRHARACPVRRAAYRALEAADRVPGHATIDVDVPVEVIGDGEDPAPDEGDELETVEVSLPDDYPA